MKHCKNVKIAHLYAEGNRNDSPDGLTHAQKLIIQPVTPCGTNVYFYVKLDNPAYGAMLTLLLTSMSTSATLDIYIDETRNDAVNGSEMIIVDLPGS
ncbi:MAG: hypothetical protein OCC49_13780 [Fibrobacterales bacterium]